MCRASPHDRAERRHLGRAPRVDGGRARASDSIRNVLFQGILEGGKLAGENEQWDLGLRFAFGGGPGKDTEMIYHLAFVAGWALR